VSETVGYVGLDVPCELIEAAGCVALRLAPVDGVDAGFADRVLGPGVDEATRLVLAGLLEGAYPIDRLVLCHDSDHTVRLYTALRRLDREAWFLDLLHEPRASTEAYDRARLAELAEWLGAGDPADAIRAANRAREAGDRLATLRRTGAIRGTDALALLRAGTALTAELVEAARTRPAAAKTVLLHGSGHDRDDVYAALEELGASVVGETHDWGEEVLAGRVDEDGDSLGALARHYRRRPRAEPPAADVSIAWLRRGDAARAWSLPPVDVVLRDRPHRLDAESRAALESALA
jgi:hypothetical protein